MEIVSDTNSREDMKQYITRLCNVAWEKSMLGDEDTAFDLYHKAIALAKYHDDRISIAASIYRADLEGGKALAYEVFKEAITDASDQVRIFLKSAFRKDLSGMVAEFASKMPDELFHLLIGAASSEKDKNDLCRFFLPMSNCIRDPDPYEHLGHQMLHAS